MTPDNKDQQRTTDYPKPTETDNQMKVQEEYIDRESNRRSEPSQTEQERKGSEQARGGNQDTLGNP